jgi:hypothetical protein
MKASKKIDQLSEQINALRYTTEARGPLVFTQLVGYLQEAKQLADSLPPSLRLPERVDAMIWILQQYLESQRFTGRHYSVFAEVVVDFNLLFDELRFFAQRQDAQNMQRFARVHAQAA